MSGSELWDRALEGDINAQLRAALTTMALHAHALTAYLPVAARPFLAQVKASTQWMSVECLRLAAGNSAGVDKLILQTEEAIAQATEFAGRIEEVAQHGWSREHGPVAEWLDLQLRRRAVTH